MEKVTLEQTHALLEKLAEYVMTQVPTRAEMDKRFEQVDKRFEQVDKRFEQMDKRFEQVDRLLYDINRQLDLIRTQQTVFAKTFELHHKRLELLEEPHAGYRVRDKDDEPQ